MDSHETEGIKLNQLESDRSVFFNGKPFFTYLFIVIQFVFFLLMEAAGGSENTATLIKFGAKINPLIIDGEWWRFILPVFIHIGFLHLFMNSIALFYIGPLVERIFGNTRFLFIYLFAGFAGSLASFVFSPHLSAGASGAIFGLFGSLLYFGIIFPKLFFRTMGMNILVVIGINLAFGFAMPSIDNAGHIGGLIGGFLATGIMHFPKKKKLPLQLLFLLVTSLLVTGLLYWGYGESTRMEDVESSLVLAQTYVEEEEFDKAHDVLKNAEKHSKGSDELLFMLSYIELKKGLVEDARKHLQQVIKINPQLHEAYYNLALIYLTEENLTEAKKLAESALRLEPDRKEYQDILNKVNKHLTGNSVKQ